MAHYICTGGCMGKSEVVGVCGVETCPKHGAPLEECTCVDGKHFGKQDQDAPQEAAVEVKE